MKRKDYKDDLMPGQSYVFQVRCSTLCGFGTNSTTVGFYHGGLFFFSSSIFIHETSLTTVPYTITSNY